MTNIITTERPVVPLHLLEALAATAPEAVTVSGARSGGRAFDLDEYIARHDLNVGPARPWKGTGRKWIGDCPWNPGHTDRSFFIAQLPNGAITAGCQHNSCQGHNWASLRDLLEPFPIPNPYRSWEVGNGKKETGAALSNPLATVVRVWERGEPAPRENVIGELVKAATMAILYADGGIGKSYLMLLWLILLLLGRDFAGRATKKIAAAVYLDAELDADEFTRRAFAVARGLGLQEPPQGLHYWQLPGPLSKPDVRDAVRTVLVGTGAEVTVLDSLTIAAGVDAGGQAEMTPILREVNSWPGTKLCIDHPPAPKAGVHTSTARPFGTTFKYNLARSVMQLVRADGGALTLRQTKNNFGPIAEPIHLALTFSSGAVTVEHLKDGDERLSGVEEHLPAMERVALALGRHAEGTTAEALAEELDVKAKTASNYLTALKQRGRAANIGGRWHSQFPIPIDVGNGNDPEDEAEEGEL